MNQKKLILYIAMSLDGYIAAPGDDLSFLAKVQQEGEDYGYGAFIQSVDTVIIGRRTYEWVMNQVDIFPHAEKTCYVITSESRPPMGNIHFYSGNLGELADELKSQGGGNIFCDGGAQVVHQLLMAGKFDALIISVIPVLLGDGIPLFQPGRPVQNLTLAEAKNYPSGLVQLHYICS